MQYYKEVAQHDELIHRRRVRHTGQRLLDDIDNEWESVAEKKFATPVNWKGDERLLCAVLTLPEAQWSRVSRRRPVALASATRTRELAQQMGARFCALSRNAAREPYASAVV